MKKIIVFIFIISLAFFGCTDSKNAVSVLSSQGYTDIEITGYSLFGCSEDDVVRTGFNAKAPNGQRVEGVVCQGFLVKGATVRFK